MLLPRPKQEADAIILGEATCTGDLISSDTYRDFIMPYHSVCARPFQCRISCTSVESLAGISRTFYRPVRPAITLMKAWILYEAVELMKGKICIAGSVPTLSVLLNGTPEEIYDYSVSAWKPVWICSRRVARWHLIHQLRISMRWHARHIEWKN